MPFQYKKIVVIGATSGEWPDLRSSDAINRIKGIGEALADRFVDEGSFVVAVGRRKENLDALASRHGHDKVETVQFDITQLNDIQDFADKIVNAHSDVDCVVLNSGMQRKCDFSDPSSIDIDLVNLEFVTNYLSYLALTKAFLPFLQSKQRESALIYVTSALALVPIPRVSNYCATKAALHQWILCLREQLKPSNINVVELYPPAVQTELHDEKHQPDVKNGRSMGMPLDEFTNQVGTPPKRLLLCQLSSSSFASCDIYLLTTSGIRRIRVCPKETSRCL